MAREQTYELMVIFDSQGDEAEIHREFDVVQSLIEKHSTEFVGRADWGLKEFKYPIKKRTSGYYVYYLFKAETDIPVQLAHALKMNERILRHMIVAGNSRSAEYLNKLRGEPVSQAEYTESVEPVKEEIAVEEKVTEPRIEEKAIEQTEEDESVNVEEPAAETSSATETNSEIDETVEIQEKIEDETEKVREEEQSDENEGNDEIEEQNEIEGVENDGQEKTEQ